MGSSFKHITNSPLLTHPYIKMGQCWNNQKSSREMQNFEGEGIHSRLDRLIEDHSGKEPVISLDQKLKALVDKYQDNAYVTMLLSLPMKEKQDYFPKQLPLQNAQIIQENTVLGCRLLFAALYFGVDTKQMPPYQTICQNQVYLKMQRLPPYRTRCLIDLGMITKSSCQLPLRSEADLDNYNFYMKAGLNGIGGLHARFQDYDFLEDRHDYIQTMFPNHFQSMFNREAKPLSYLQAQLFRNSTIIGLRLLKSVVVFFDFLGIRLGLDCKLGLISMKRLTLALLVNSHNHLRIRRILACLSVCGFREIALKLLAFIHKVVSEQHEFNKLSYVFESEWELYSDRNLSRALELCFHLGESFPVRHQVMDMVFEGSGKEEEPNVEAKQTFEDF